MLPAGPPEIVAEAAGGEVNRCDGWPFLLGAAHGNNPRTACCEGGNERAQERA